MIFTILSAILLILSFPNFNLSYLIFIAFIPVFFAIQNRNPKKAFIISYICGFLFYIGTLYWLYHVTAFGLIVLCLYLALYFGVLGLCFSLITHRSSPITIFLVPFIWILLEYIQSHLFTGFGWVLLGYSQYKNTLFIQIADFSGVYGVSFLIMMVNVSIWQLIKNNILAPIPRASAIYCFARGCLLLLIPILAAYFYGFYRLNQAMDTNAVKISVIQGNIPQEFKWDTFAKGAILNRYESLTKMAALNNPDLIIWPETSFPGFFIEDKIETEIVLNLVKGIKTPLLAGVNTVRGLRNFNSAVLVSKDGKVLDKYDKIHLVPFGEYAPFSKKIPLLRDILFGELGEFTAGDEFKVFSFSPKFAVLICFEDIFPELARKFVQNGAEFLVVITNDAWYSKTSAPYQHAACSVFRAIENRVPVVRCANTGYSCFIDSKGRIYDSVKEGNNNLFVTGYKTAGI